MTTTDLAVKGEPRPTIVQFVNGYSSQIAEALPTHIPPERFLRLLLNEMRKTPDLQRCTPESVVGAMLTASSLGLEFGPNGECFMIPFENKRYDRELRQDVKVMEAEFVPGYKGIAKLFWQHPLAARLSAEYVCERDAFEFDKGLRPYLHHTPAKGDRGPVVAFYAIVGLQGREPWFDVFTPEQIKSLRNGAVGPKGKIKDPERWLERKTALLQVMKLAPKSSQLQAAIAVDERSGADLWASSAPRAILRGEPVPEVGRPELSLAGEEINEATGEVLGQPEPAAAPAPAPKPEAPKALTRATGSGIVKAFDSLGVGRSEVDAYLPVLMGNAAPSTLSELTEPDGVELLVALNGLTRDGLRAMSAGGES